MNILFLTLVDIRTVQSHGIYTDLLRELSKSGNDLYIVSPIEKRYNEETHVIKESGFTILKPQIGNTQKTSSLIEKGISTVMIEPIFRKAIREYFSDVKFDLVLYSTPPITLVSAIRYVKKRDHALTYLLLKDIFPQNAVDLGMMAKSGVKGILYKHFRKKEKELYAVSDKIGCMSQANVDFLKKQDPEIDPDRIEICPNSLEIEEKAISLQQRLEIRSKYQIPQDKRVIVFGGNLGKPQSIPFLISCLERCRDIGSLFFLIIGSGTDYGLLSHYLETSGQENARLMKFIPKEDYDVLVSACDIGLIVLDHKFTIPNFPSRILGYMQTKLPILALTDPNTDVGKVITGGEFGWWSESSDPEKAAEVIHRIAGLSDSQIRQLGENGFRYLEAHYSVRDAAKTILDAYRNRSVK